VAPARPLTVDEIHGLMARRVEAMVAEGTPRATAQLAVYESWMRVSARQGASLTGLRPAGLSIPGAP
jgi:hypothetical protein